MDSAAIEAARKRAEQAGFNDMEISAIGEVANITLGNAMTALSMLLHNDIDISTPFVEIKQRGEIVEELAVRSVITRVDYVKGLDGYSVLFLKEDDVKIMTDLMMGSDGHGMFYEQELSELHLSAVSESMNQMSPSETHLVSHVAPIVATIALFTTPRIGRDIATVARIGSTMISSRYM